jgi:NAD(P)-dependent dehydrogenase (short-subunit alcohol dehydrogenase family)
MAGHGQAKGGAVASSEQRVAVVTGAGTGIGRAVTLELGRLGYRLVIAGRRAEPLEETAGHVAGADVEVVPTDVADPAAVEALFARAVGAFGRVDLLFNNAGISGGATPTEDVSFEQWTAVVDTNLTGSFLCAQQAIRVMKQQDPQGGRIINNGSISAHTPRPNSVAYTATKHAITGLTKSIALDGRPYRIACGQIDIGNAGAGLAASLAPVGPPRPGGQPSGEPRMDVQHVADAVAYMAGLPLDANVLFMTVMATNMPYVGRG